MNYQLLLIAIVFVPIIGSAILPLIGKCSKASRNIAALVLTAAPFVLSLVLLPQALAGSAASFSYPMPYGINFSFSADLLAVFMALVSSSISAIIVFYSFSYIGHYENQNEYYFMVVLFLGSMMGLIYSENLIFLYIFWEMTAIACWRLIGFFREKSYILKADKAFLITMFGALAMLIGFLMIYSLTGSFDLGIIKQKIIQGNIAIPALAVLLILAGIFSKSATLPFQTWLPDAGVAPSPVTALLHAAVLVKIGVYVFARIFIVTIPLPQVLLPIVLSIVGLSALISAGAAMVDSDLKRIIAYSTISQIGFIFLGLSMRNEIAITGALLYILMHGLAKGGLFLCAGIVEQKTKTKDINKMGGLISKMPITALCFLFCAFSIMGLPPFGGFFSKYMVITGATNSGQTLYALFFVVIAFMTIIYLMRAFNKVFMGESTVLSEKEGLNTMTASVIILAFFSLAFGIFINYPANIAHLAANFMLGGIR